MEEGQREGLELDIQTITGVFGLMVLEAGKFNINSQQVLCCLSS